MTIKYSLYINGKWIETNKTINVIDKFSGELFARVSISSEQEVEAAILAAFETFRTHSLSPYQRYKILAQASTLMEARADELALIIARESGKVFKDAKTEVLQAAQVFLLVAEEAKQINGELIPSDTSPGTENRIAYTSGVPVGVVCAISPFNFPLNLACYAPALASGNTVILKPASTTPVSAIKICEILEEAGLPPGYINMVLGGDNEVGNILLNDERIDFYTFTESPRSREKNHVNYRFMQSHNVTWFKFSPYCS